MLWHLVYIPYTIVYTRCCAIVLSAWYLVPGTTSFPVTPGTITTTPHELKAVLDTGRGR